MSFLELAKAALASQPPEQDAPSADRLDRDGYLVVRSRHLGRTVLVVLDPERVPDDLGSLPTFTMDEVGKLLTLRREDARALLPAILKTKLHLGGAVAEVTTEETP